MSNAPASFWAPTRSAFANTTSAGSTPTITAASKLTDKASDLPDDLTHVVVIVNEMDHQTIQTVPSALSGAATGQGYSRDIIAVLSVTQYIRNLGYRAVASLNDTALSIPLAIQAGLGQYGRHGLLITPEFGPRVRIAKIFTDLPLIPDQPIDFGVTETCNICRRCSDGCPVKAIPDDAPKIEIHDGVSHLRGVKKWTINARQCFKFWVNQGTDCSICIRVCPYNKDFSKRFNRLLRWMLSNRWRRLALWLDAKLKYGERKTAGWWWGAPLETDSPMEQDHVSDSSTLAYVLQIQDRQFARI